MDSITAKGLEFRAIHGCLPEETEQPQLFVLDLHMFLDLSAAMQSDELNDTVDYAEAYRIISEIMTGPPRCLLERLAAEIGQALLDAFPRLDAVELELKKPEAPVKGAFEFFGVTIRISR